MDGKKRLSFVIPCYRSEQTVAAVIDEIRQVAGGADWEIVAVNDGSPDGVMAVLEDLAARDHRVKVVDLAKNMGKHAALMAGYARTTGDIVVGLDDDGQCPLDRLWDLLAPLDQGYDIAIARYGRKRQSRFKNFGSRVNDWMARFLLGKPKDLKTSNFYAMRRFVCDEIVRCRNPFPYVEGLFLRTTSAIANVDMDERERIAGRSGYGLRKSLALWLNGFTAFSVKPLRLASVLGFLVAILGFLIAFITVVRKLMYPAIAAGYSSLLAAVLVIGGMIMVLLGVIGEYVGRIYICLNDSPQYVVRRTINIDGGRKGQGDAE